MKMSAQAKMLALLSRKRNRERQKKLTVADVDVQPNTKITVLIYKRKRHYLGFWSEWKFEKK